MRTLEAGCLLLLTYQPLPKPMLNRVVDGEEVGSCLNPERGPITVKLFGVTLHVDCDEFAYQEAGEKETMK